MRSVVGDIFSEILLKYFSVSIFLALFFRSFLLVSSAVVRIFYPFLMMLLLTDYKPDINTRLQLVLIFTAVRELSLLGTQSLRIILDFKTMKSHGMI